VSVTLALPVLACNPTGADAPSAPPSTRSLATPNAPVAARAATRESPQAQDVIDALKAYEQAVVASDTVTLKQIWSDDYVFINPQGVLVTRAERLANFASGATNVVEGVNQREIRVRVYGDAAVLTQLFTLRGRFGGVETNTEVRGGFTWIKRAGRWQLVMNEITLVTP
jgi:ketosteroid isomerase-like protein